MAQLWGGRFTKQTDQLVFDFNASITFDKRLLSRRMSPAVSHMPPCWQNRGSSPRRREKSIIEGLTGILEDVDDGTLAID